MHASSSISALQMQVPALDGLAGIDEFYRSVLGMQHIQFGTDEYSCAYSATGCRIVFRERAVGPFINRDTNQYWKVGITVKNLDVAVRYIREQGVDVSTPRQFRDIGYMSHLTDPNGFNIELLQRRFEGREQAVAEGHPVGVQATLAHITLRVTDIESAKRYFGDELGMRLMSVQPVAGYRFCLYFYTWSDEALPNTDLESVHNREWLWARPYAFIELQHLQAPDAVIHKRESHIAGFEGFSYQCAGMNERFVSVDSDDFAGAGFRP